MSENASPSDPEKGSSHPEDELLPQETLDVEIQELVSDPERQREARISLFRKRYEGSIRNVLATEVDDEEYRQGQEATRNLFEFLDQIELQGMATTGFHSELFSTTTSLKETADELIVESFGDQREKIEEWLGDIKMRSFRREEDSRDYFSVERGYPPNYNYNSISIFARSGKESVRYRGQDFHGKESHYIQYVINMDEEPHYDKVGFPVQKRFVEIDVHYMTDSDGNIYLGDPTSNTTLRIRWVGFEKPGTQYFTDTQDFNKEQGACVVDWVEQHTGGLFDKMIKVNRDNTVVTAQVIDYRGYAVNKPIDEIDLDKEIERQKRRDELRQWQKDNLKRRRD